MSGIYIYIYIYVHILLLHYFYFKYIRSVFMIMHGRVIEGPMDAVWILSNSSFLSIIGSCNNINPKIHAHTSWSFNNSAKERNIQPVGSLGNTLPNRVYTHFSLYKLCTESLIVYFKEPRMNSVFIFVLLFLLICDSNKIFQTFRLTSAKNFFYFITIWRGKIFIYCCNDIENVIFRFLNQKRDFKWF